MELITAQQLFLLDRDRFDDYHNLLKHLVAKPIIGKRKINSLTELSFGEVALMKLVIQEPRFESIIKIFKVAFGLKKKQVLQLDVISFYHALNWLKEEVRMIYEREAKNLNAETDSKLKDAGIDRLNIFGEMNTLIALGQKFSKPPQEIENWNYNLVFTLTMHEKISREIQKRFQELNTKTND